MKEYKDFPQKIKEKIIKKRDEAETNRGTKKGFYGGQNIRSARYDYWDGFFDALNWLME